MPKIKETGEVRRKYESIKSRQGKYNIRMMRRLMDVAASGCYAWLKTPISKHAIEDARLLRLIKASFTDSHCVYGAPSVFLDRRKL